MREMTKLKRAFSALPMIVLFFLGLAWSFRNLGIGTAKLVGASALGSIVYYLLFRLFVILARRSDEKATLWAGAGRIGCFLALAITNIAVWGVLLLVLSQ